AKPSVKPHLEWLEDRLVPSASSTTLPAVAEAPSQLVATMNQWNQALVKLGDELSNIEQVQTQEIAQFMAYCWQQWDHLLGIGVNTSPSSSNAAAPTTSSRSDS